VSVAPGEIVLDDAWRAFAIGDRRRTLKEFVTRRGAQLDTVQALAGVNLHVRPGETVGIVGRNGAGKTSTLRVLAGIIPLDRGRAECGGRVATLIELGAGFGREFTGRENILLNGALNGLDKREIEERLDDIIEFSELGHFVDVPIKAYSSGMLVRLGFAIAANLDADIMLIDEVLAVGDVGFQRKCLRAIRERIEAGATLVLVSHSSTAIERTCERVLVLQRGNVAFDGPTPEGLLRYHELIGAEDLDVPAPEQEGRTVFVETVELQGPDGQRRTVFRTGEPLRIVLGVGARAGATPTRIAFELRRTSGEPVFSAGHVVDLSGPARVTFDIPALHLLGGDYDLVVAAQQGEGIDRLVSLSVAATPDVEGVADLRGSWSVDTVVAR
jgi:ABC-type polysaccharide/polyol phosphate transport system ATPase subunit